MKVVANETDFIALIGAENQCIIFCFFNWSGYSVISKKIVENWERYYNREIILIDCSNFDSGNYFPYWLSSQENGDWAKEGIMTVNKFTPTIIVN